MDRPNRLNTLNKDLVGALSQGMDQVRTDSQVKAIYLDSASSKTFCAGGGVADIYKGVRVIGEDPIPYSEREFILDEKMAKFPKLTTVAYRGIVTGGGLGLSMDYPIRTADETTRMVTSEARLGVVPDVGMDRFFSRMNQAMTPYMSLTGSRING